MSSIATYLGPLGNASGPCTILGIEGYAIDTSGLFGRLKPKSRGLDQYDFFVVKGYPGFRTQTLSTDHKIDVGVKRVDLEFSLKDGAVARDVVPGKEEDVSKKEVECEYGITLSAKGEVDFKPFTGTIGPEGKWHKVVKYVEKSVNSYCVAVGALTPSPSWTFQPRTGENHLQEEKQVLLTVQAPKGKKLGGSLKMVSRNLVLLDENHKELSRMQSFVAKIRRLIQDDKYYKPIKFSFEDRPENRAKLGIEVARVVDGNKRYLFWSESQLREATRLMEEHLDSSEMVLPPPSTPGGSGQIRLEEGTAQLIDKELSRAKSRGLI